MKPPLLPLPPRSGLDENVIAVHPPPSPSTSPENPVAPKTNRTILPETKVCAPPQQNDNPNLMDSRGPRGIFLLQVVAEEMVFISPPKTSPNHKGRETHAHSLLLWINHAKQTGTRTFKTGAHCTLRAPAIRTPDAQTEP